MINRQEEVLRRNLQRLETRIEILEQLIDATDRRAASLRHYVNSWTGQKDIVIPKDSSSSAAGDEVRSTEPQAVPPPDGEERARPPS